MDITNRLLLHIGLLILLLILCTGCVPHSYTSRVPALADLPKKYLSTNNRVLVLPLWFKEPALVTDEKPPLGHFFFDKPYIVPFRELKEIHNRIPSKTSSGLITLASATGSWTKLNGIYLIVDDGFVIYKEAAGRLGLEPVESWFFTQHAWVGPKLKEELITIVKARGEVDCSLVSLIMVDPRPTIIKNKFSTSDRKKIISFLESIDVDILGTYLDTWSSRIL